MHFQKILHQESYFYPGQLSMISAQSSKVKKFLFNSPINSFSTIFDIKSRQYDFIDFEGSKYSKMNTLQLSEDKKCTVKYELDRIKFITSTDSQIEPIHIDQQRQTLSDFVSLNLSKDNELSLAYLTLKKQGLLNQVHLNIKKYNQLKSVTDSQQHKINPETEQFEISQEQKHSQKHFSIQQKYTETSSIELEIPFSHQLKPSAYHVFQINSNTNSFDKQLTLFCKKSSTAYIYDMEYSTFSNVISCKYDQQRQMITDIQANKIHFLSQNLILNSHQNGVIKLTDKRVGKVVHVRNLSQEIIQFGQRTQTQKQQNFIKFWNASKTQTIENPIQPTFNFLINLKNKVYQADLRNNRLTQQDEVFKFDKDESLGNYQILQDQDERILAFTTESHSDFKAYTVLESQKN